MATSSHTPVYLHLKAWAASQSADPGARMGQIEARAALGLDRYGRHLTADTAGRDHVVDAEEELLDFMMYFMAARLNGDSVAPLETLWQDVIKMGLAAGFDKA